MYWDIYRTLSYNALFNFIVGARSVGKSYGCKKWAIKDFLKTGAQFIYIRRFKEDIQRLPLFFDDIQAEFPGVKFKVKGNKLYINEEIAGHAFTISKANLEKSTPYPKVNKIIFDEFLLDTSEGYHRYIPNEPKILFKFYSTVARMREVKVFLCSNSITISNPYFDYFKIERPYQNEIACKDDILIQEPNCPEISQKSYETRAGKILARIDPEYAAYQYDNVYLKDTDDFIQKKTVKSTYQFALKYKSVVYGIWVDYDAGLQYVSLDYHKSGKLMYSITMDDHSENTMLIKGQKSVLVKSFYRNYLNGTVRFESVKVKNACANIIKLLH